MISKTKTLIWDIEIVVDVNENLIERLYTGFLRPGMLMSANMAHMLMFGYKWKGEKKSRLISMSDYPKDFKNNHLDDSKICADALEILQEADHLVAHYGDKFDRKFLETRLLINKLPAMPSKTMLRQSDTCQIAKTYLKFDSNRLDVLAKTLGLDQKAKKDWPGWWMGAAFGDIKSVKEMEPYCKQDVGTLGQVYNELERYDIKAMNPNIEYLGNRDEYICTCGSKKLVSRGFKYTSTGKYRRFICKECGRGLSESKAIETSQLRI